MVDHRIFKSQSRQDAKSDDEGNNGCEKVYSSSHEEEEETQAQNQSESLFHYSPIANLEALVGKACDFDDIQKDDGDHFLGLLIAAYAVFTTCITDTNANVNTNTNTSTCVETDTTGTGINQRTFEDYKLLASSTKDNDISLQVAGPLSIHTHTCSKLLAELNKNDFDLNIFSNLLLDPVLMDYFREAAAVCEEREEVQNANDLGASQAQNMKTLESKGEHKEKNKDSKDKQEDNTEAAPMEPMETQSENIESPSPEANGYSFVEEDSDEDDDDDQNSSQDEDSCVSSSSEEEIQHDDDDDKGEVDEENSESQLPGNNEDTEMSNSDQINAQKDTTLDDDKETNDNSLLQDIDNESTLLKQAVVLSLSEFVKPLPSLPLHPDKNYVPKDYDGLDPMILGSFGKLSSSNAFVYLLFMALKKVEHQVVNSRTFHPSFHIMIALLNVLSNARAESMNSLCVLVDNLKDFEVKLNSNDDLEDGVSEDDDPAFTIASNVATASSPSESLEEKGFIRKAAAAAQSASLLRGKMIQEIHDLKERMKLYSFSSYFLMKCLREYLQKARNASKRTSINCFLRCSILTITRVRLLASLTNYTSATQSYQHNSILSGDIYLPLPLLFEATSLWGESTPLIYATTLDLEKHFHHLVKTFFLKNPTNFERTVFGDTQCPWSDHQVNLLKLNAMCQRMISEDVMSLLVPSPKSCTNTKFSMNEELYHSSIYQTMAKLYYEVLPHYDTSLIENMKSLFLALHYKHNHHLLLWGTTKTKQSHLSSLNIDLHDTTRNNADCIENKVSLTENFTLSFDSSKCADSIALVSSGSGSIGAHQRASKAWGTALGSKAFEPKTGVHRWALRMDKCERGHIFVGVGTSRASKKTYVGGDKFSWGFIGTQALWHERRKIRSDYGATFRTGSIIVVTLDTNLGTLRFGLLHDSATSTNEDDTPQSIEILQSKFNEGIGDSCGYIEDWGIAFEGLPLDAKLYPAVGLYQRDDKVTLMHVLPDKARLCDSLSQNDIIMYGLQFYPDERKQNTLDNIDVQVLQRYNSDVCNDGISFVSNVLNHVPKALNYQSDNRADASFFRSILPSLASSLALYPTSVPILSGRFAMVVLPLIEKCVMQIEEKINEKSRWQSPVLNMIDGRWKIKATTCGASPGSGEDYEEYVVNIEQNEENKGFHGEGIGTNGKSTNCAVSIVGACKGTCIQFVEEWNDEYDTTSDLSYNTSSCIIDARLNLSGTSFEGMYKNVHYGTCGNISGEFQSEEETNFADNDLQQSLVLCSNLLGLAASHLSCTLSCGAPLVDVAPDLGNENNMVKNQSMEKVKKMISSSPLLSNGLISNNSDVESCFNNLISTFYPENSKLELHFLQSQQYWKKYLLPTFRVKHASPSFPEKLTIFQIHNIDTRISQLCGGFGSFFVLNPQLYNETRLRVISLLIYHSGLDSNKMCEGNTGITADIEHIWRTALKIMETGVRTSMLSSHPGTSRKDSCIQFCLLAENISDFLMTVHRTQKSHFEKDIIYEIQQLFIDITNSDDLNNRKRVMSAKRLQSMLNIMGPTVIQNCLNGNIKTCATIESMISSWDVSFRHEYVNMEINNEKSLFSFYKLDTGWEKHVDRLRSEIIRNLCSFVIDILGESSFLYARENVPVSIQSLSNTILANLFPLVSRQCITNDDIYWKFLTLIMSKSKEAVGETLCKDRIAAAMKSKSTIAELLSATMARKNSSMLLVNASSFIHVILYFLYNAKTLGGKNVVPSASIPLAMLENELSITLDTVKQCYMGQITLDSSSKARREYNKWIDTMQKKSQNIMKKKEYCNDNELYVPNGIITFLADGGAHFQTQKVSPKCDLDSAIFKHNSCDEYMNLLLDAMSTLARSNIHSHWLYHDNTWLKNLICVIVESSDTTSLPLHFRVRILRLLRFMIPRSMPDEHLVKSLFRHIGCTLLSIPSSEYVETMDLPDMECYIEVKEVVSLLRTIYVDESVQFENKSQWLNCMNNIFSSISLDDTTIIRGIQTFYGGLPDKLVVGTCVLLRPSMASLQPTLKSNSERNRTKNNVASFGTVATSSGTETIIAGLCRRDMLAGRISDINIRKGMCEIVLFDRSDEVEKDAKKNSSHTMSFRAVKVPLQEVIPADETELLIDSDHFPTKLMASPSIIASLTFTKSLLHQANKNNNEVKECASSPEQDIEKLIDVALGLRSSSVLFSNIDTAKKFLQDEEIASDIKRDFFSTLLSIGSIESVGEGNMHVHTACNDSLSSLPEYQALFWYLRGLLVEVTRRKCSLDSVAFESMCTILPKAVEDRDMVTPAQGNHAEEISTTPAHVETNYIASNEISDRPRRIVNDSEFQSNSIETVNDDEEEEEETFSSRLSQEAELDNLREAAIVQMLELVSLLRKNYESLLR
jgi:hypothetical protein